MRLLSVPGNTHIVEHSESFVAVGGFRAVKFPFSLVTKFLVDFNAIVTGMRLSCLLFLNATGLPQKKTFQLSRLFLF